MSDPVPLYETTEAPVPPGAEPAWLAARDGVRLRAVLVPAANPRGTVVFSPGRTEPIEKYHEVVGELVDRGFTVLIHDWRGQGLSDRLAPDDRKKGCANGWQPFVDDYSRILSTYQDRLPRPWIAMGHSMGGGLTLLALAEGEGRFDAAMLSAPMCDIDTGGIPPVAARIIARLMTVLGRGQHYATPPADALSETFETTVLTHDDIRFRRSLALYQAHPDLVLGSVTWGWIDFALQLAARLRRPGALEAVPIPLVIVTAEEERLVRNAAARAMAARAPAGTHVEVAGAYHEVLMETDPRRAVFWSAFESLVSNLPASSGR
jgi:lysophospholipase